MLKYDNTMSKKYHNAKNLTVLQCEIMNNSKKERDNESLQQKIRQTANC